MKNGKFIGKECIFPTSEEIENMKIYLEKILTKYAINYQRIDVEKISNPNNERHKYLADYIKINAVIFNQPTNGLCKYTRNELRDFSKITLTVYKSNGYSEYQKAVNNEAFDMFNQFSVYVRCDGQIRMFKRKNYEVIEPKNHYIYNDEISELFDEIEIPIVNIVQMVQ